MAGRKRRIMLVALSVACAAVAAFPHSAFAEQAVGLEAQGVDPWAAVHNPQGLDVRDAEGHPVSAQIIAQQLRAAAPERLSEAASLSRLPKARLIFKLIELATALGGLWRTPRRAPTVEEVWALPSRLRQGRDVLPSSEAACLGILVIALGCCRSQLISRRSLQKSEVLRC